MIIMRYRKTLRILLGILKDKTSMIKATLSNSTAQLAVLRATTHSSAPPPPEAIAAVLSLGHDSRPTACACVESLMDRLHSTQNATVSLKCLLAIHNVLTKGSFIIKDQLSFNPCFGGRNYLNLSMFKDHSDPDTWQLSGWVRWYAGFLEQNVAVSRICGDHHSKEERALGLLNEELLGELDVLTEFVERVSGSPGSSSSGLVYEVLRLVGEDYRLVQREIFVRVVELGQRVGDMSLTELTRSMDSLGKLEGCRERLFSVFLRRNDAFWDLVKETEAEVAAMVEQKRGEKMLMIELKRMDESSELIRGSSGSGQLVRLTSDGGCLGLGRVPLIVSTIG